MSRFRYKAIEADYQGAANMYLQGKMAVQEAKNKVRAERAEQLQEVTDASKFVATNSTDLNNLTYGFANLIRNNLSNTTSKKHFTLKQWIWIAGFVKLFP
jgi:hypothetical protein